MLKGQSHRSVIIAEDSLVVAEVDDLQPQHVTHLLGQGLQLVGVQEQHGCILPVTHLREKSKRWRLPTAEQPSRPRSRMLAWCVCVCVLTSGGSWTRKLWSAAKVRMQVHWPMEEGKASISLKLQSSSSSMVSLQRGGGNELVLWDLHWGNRVECFSGCNDQCPVKQLCAVH